MTKPQPDSRGPVDREWAKVGYVLFATGAALGIWLACVAWEPQSDDNPAVVLVLTWVSAGISHICVRGFWRACVVSAFGSVFGYVVFAVALTPDPFANEMFGAGVIEVAIFGFVLSMVMGIPVVVFRRTRTVRTAERPSESPAERVRYAPAAQVVCTGCRKAFPSHYYLEAVQEREGYYCSECR